MRKKTRDKRRHNIQLLSDLRRQGKLDREGVTLLKRLQHTNGVLQSCHFQHYPWKSSGNFTPTYQKKLDRRRAKNKVARASRKANRA